MENQNLEKDIIEDQNLGEVVLISVPVSENFLALANGQYYMSSTPEEIESELSDNTLLKNLLQEFQMESVFRYLKDCKVTFKSLQYMKKDDIKEAIPALGLRMEFREKLFAWKKREFGIDEDTLSMPSKIGDWLKNCREPISTDITDIC